MKKIYSLILLLGLPLWTVLASGISETELDIEAARALLDRVIPRHAHHFEIETIAQEDGKDVFELEQMGSKIILRGNNGISVASALNYY